VTYAGNSKTVTEKYEMLQKAWRERALSQSNTFERYSPFKNGHTYGKKSRQW
jgi:hypothetical protein